MKRYWLFICPTYYPSGGMHDFYNSYEAIQEAQGVAERISKSKDGELINYYDPSDIYAHIWDSEDKKIIVRYDRYEWAEHVPPSNEDLRHYEGSFPEPRL